MSPLRRRLLPLCAFALALGGTGTAQADTLGDKVLRMGRTIGFAELATPDLRLLVGDGAPDVALAWPLVVGLGDVWFGMDADQQRFRVCSGCSELGTALYVSAFMEPQLLLSSVTPRGLFGLRALVHRDAWLPFAFAIDAGGLGDHRGPGGFVGASMGAEVFGIALLGGGRRLWMEQGAAWEWAIDLMVPMQWLPGG